MKKENLKLLVVIIVGLLVYLTFFIETVEDVPVQKKLDLEIQKKEIQKDTLQRKEITQ